MDQIKIGKFIAEMRKEQNLTQIDLAEKLGISNKTVSKWECGNGMPDYAVMEVLCDALQINVNELLSGERLPSKDYNKKAEENMMSLMQESSENRKHEKREAILVFLGIIGILFVVAYNIIMCGGVAFIGNFIDIPTFTCVTSVVILALALAGKLKDFIRAFSIAVKKDKSIGEQEIHKSMIAMKTAIIAINLAGLLNFMIGLVVSLTMAKIEDPKACLTWLAVALLSIVYALVTTIVFVPIYMRLKGKLIKE
ncbi:MAG: helix-turn-helix domain-containing protein [Agathobacter sp.]|nr:helix-turn-helix domain-containing protein [Agathobacter sp.]